MKLFRRLLSVLLLATCAGRVGAEAPAPEVENGYLRLGFDRLASYRFVPPDFDPAADAKPAPTAEELDDQTPSKAKKGKKKGGDAALEINVESMRKFAEEQIPDVVKAWNGKKAIVTGFMLPVKMQDGLVTEFLLVKDPMMCCYGVVPNMNEWVVVKMVKGGVKPLMDLPISFYGTLKVGAMFENGYMTGVYLLEGEKMGDVKN